MTLLALIFILIPIGIGYHCSSTVKFQTLLCLAIEIFAIDGDGML